MRCLPWDAVANIGPRDISKGSPQRLPPPGPAR